MPRHKKVEIKFSIRLKRCDMVFAEGFEPGEISTHVLSYTITEEQINSPIFKLALQDKAKELMDEDIDVIIERVK